MIVKNKMKSKYTLKSKYKRRQGHTFLHSPSRALFSVFLQCTNFNPMLIYSATKAQSSWIHRSIECFCGVRTIIHSPVHDLDYRWMQQRQALLTANKSTRKMGSGRRVMFPNEESRLADSVASRRSIALAVTATDLQSTMRKWTPPSLDVQT
jgi:hypothetical protein